MLRRVVVLFTMLILEGIVGRSHAADPADEAGHSGCSSRCLHIRYEDEFDFSDEVLQGREDDPRLKLKRIPLGDSWNMDVGGEFRLRWESRTNADFGQTPRSQNAQQDYRWFLHTNIKYRDLFRLFAQGAFNHVEDQEGPFQPTLENHGDLQQLFFDWRVFGAEVPVSLRIGRQELSYGAYRLVGPLDWVSNRRRFDAIKLVYRLESWRVDAFYAKPVVVQRKSPDAWNEGYDFFGLYTQYKGIPKHGIDLYLFAVDRTEDTTNPNGRSGDQSIYTLGTRFFGRTAAWDYDTELAGQWGTWAGDTVQAWNWAVDGGYTIGDSVMKPRVSAGFEWASGDDNPDDRTAGTFNQLFPFDHQCIGMQDLVGHQNLTRVYFGFDLWPIADKLKSSLVFLNYWLSEEKDSLYNAGGVPLLRDRRGHGGVDFGQELDLWIEWEMTENSTLSMGYSHFWDDRLVHSLARSDDDPDLFIVQYRYRF
ncbi:MAG: alginate export family protein [Planctomycetota bacterium]